ARRRGFEAHALRNNVPRVRQAVHEVVAHLRRLNADILCCHGYKPDVIGWRAARLTGIPVVSVSHGWTAVTLKVRMYESLDRLVLRWMDKVVGVSEAQAEKGPRPGFPAEHVWALCNAMGGEAFAASEPAYFHRLPTMCAVP